MPDKVTIYITPYGYETDWWTEDIADLLCSCCGQCCGWKETPPMDCIVANRYCG